MRWNVALPVAAILATAACASVAHDGDGPHHWPRTDVAQRDIPVEAIYADEQARPWKLWLISKPDPAGNRYAIEFFSGERVPSVHVEAETMGQTPDSTWQVNHYTFHDEEGRQYESVTDDSSDVEAGSPEIASGWRQGRVGHDVRVGGYLFTDSQSSGVVPVGAESFFGEEPVCDARIFVVRTQGSLWQDTAANFSTRTRILADYDPSSACWNTRQFRSMSLGDNTFLVTTKNRSFRINSWDLTPAGSAPDLRLIEVKED